MDINNTSFQIINTIAELEQTPFIALSGEMKIEHCNQLAISFFSLPPNTIIGRGIEDVFDGLIPYLELFKKTISTKQSKKIPSITLQNKSSLPFELLLIPVENLLCILIKKCNAPNNAHNTSIINKKEMLANLIANICNNFNNILGAINGNSSILKDICETIIEISLKEEMRGYLDLIDKSVIRATELVSQLNSFSAKINVSFKEVDLNDIIRNLYIGYLTTLDQCITVDAEVLSTKAMVRVDPTLIETSLKDLCENAVHSMTVMRGAKYAYQGGTLTLTLNHVETEKSYRAQHPKAIKSSYWVVTIADTGVGIKKDLIKKVFTPFFSDGKSILNSDGLGLSFANTTLQENGGFIEIESELGVGTKVNIFIPEYKSSDVKKEKLSLENSKIIAKNDHEIISTKPLLNIDDKQNMLLIADDDIIMRKVAEVILEKAGYKVLLAADGYEAVNVYKDKYRNIAGVFLDNSMPRMSGIEAFYEMKKLNPLIKAILLSGHDEESDEVKQAMANGIMGFIKKPYTVIDLNKKVKELFDR